MNVDKISKELLIIINDSWQSSFMFYSDEIIDSHSDLFWKFVQAGSYDSYEEIPEEFGVTKDIYSASKNIYGDYWLHSTKEDIYSAGLEYYFTCEGNLAVQISFIMEVFKFGNITDSVEYLIHGRKDDKKIFAGILTVNSETMSYKELK